MAMRECLKQVKSTDIQMIIAAAVLPALPQMNH
jgi:hypothetical protein